MYCSLEDAFPQDSAQQRKSCTTKKEAAGIRASCWMGDEEKQAAAVVKGANVVTAGAPSGPAGQIQNPEGGPCFSALHHCLSCATCQHMLKLHYLSTSETRPEIVIGAQVGRRSLHSRGKRKSRRVFGAQVQAPPLHFLNQPILVGSNVTWGHLLIILTAGAFLLLLVDRLKK